MSIFWITYCDFLFPAGILKLCGEIHKCHVYCFCLVDGSLQPTSLSNSFVFDTFVDPFFWDTLSLMLSAYVHSLLSAPLLAFISICYIYTYIFMFPLIFIHSQKTLT